MPIHFAFQSTFKSLKMKKADIIISIAVAAYTLLFYDQMPGLNYMLFNMVLVFGAIVLNRSVLAQSRWLITAITSFSTATCVLIYGNSLSIVGNIISLAALSAFSFEPSSSLIIATINGFYSFLVSFPIKIIQGFNRKYLQPTTTFSNGVEEPTDDQMGNIDRPQTKAPTAISFVAVLFAVSIAILFLLVYRAANPHFKALTDQFDIQGVWPVLRFAFGGLIIITGYYQHQAIKYLNKKDTAASSTLTELTTIAHDKTLMGFIMNMKNTITSGLILFGLLNLMLLSVNYFDVKYIWLDHPMGTEVAQSHAEALHQSVNILIISILMAIALILAYFRGSLNFNKDSKPLKALAYLWVAQNVVLVASVAVRNYQYIDNFGLTYKRIGVFVYLLLTLSGLVTTLIKVWQYRSNWYLFRVNGWVFFTVLVVSCYANWDAIIARYNIANTTKRLDVGYLLKLGYPALPFLNELDDDYFKYYEARSFNNKVKDLIEDEIEQNWQAWCIQRHNVATMLTDNFREKSQIQYDEK